LIYCDARTRETEPEKWAPRQAAGDSKKRLSEQIRKILGKHYGSKYRVR